MTLQLNSAELKQAMPIPAADLTAARDYDVVRRVIEHISENYQEQPNLETLADLVGLSPVSSAETVHPLGGPLTKRLFAVCDT